MLSDQSREYLQRLLLAVQEVYSKETQHLYTIFCPRKGQSSKSNPSFPLHLSSILRCRRELEHAIVSVRSGEVVSIADTAELYHRQCSAEFVADTAVLSLSQTLQMLSLLQTCKCCLSQTLQMLSLLQTLLCWLYHRHSKCCESLADTAVLSLSQTLQMLSLLQTCKCWVYRRRCKCWVCCRLANAESITDIANAVSLLQTPQCWVCCRHCNCWVCCRLANAEYRRHCKFWVCCRLANAESIADTFHSSVYGCGKHSSNIDVFTLTEILTLAFPWIQIKPDHISLSLDVDKTRSCDADLMVTYTCCGGLDWPPFDWNTERVMEVDHVCNDQLESGHATVSDPGLFSGTQSLNRKLASLFCLLDWSLCWAVPVHICLLDRWIWMSQGGVRKAVLHIVSSWLHMFLFSQVCVCYLLLLLHITSLI